jgi:hypothetical protein
MKTKKPTVRERRMAASIGRMTTQISDLERERDSLKRELADPRLVADLAEEIRRQEPKISIVQLVIERNHLRAVKHLASGRNIREAFEKLSTAMETFDSEPPE